MILYLLRCQGFGVAYYSLTLGRLGFAAPSAFETSGVILCWKATFTKEGLYAIMDGIEQNSLGTLGEPCQHNSIMKQHVK